MYEILIGIPRKRLGEDVCNLLLGRNIVQLDIFFGDLFSYKMILYGDMICLGVHDWILGDIDYTCAITQNWNRLLELYLDIFQGLFHPMKLGTTCCCCNVFSLCCGQGD